MYNLQYNFEEHEIKIIQFDFSSTTNKRGVGDKSGMKRRRTVGGLLINPVWVFDV
jgi:hypothetical protein